MLKCPGIDIDKTDDPNEVNAAWLAAYYGHLESLVVLANSKANILCKHKITQANILHVAIQQKHDKIAESLIKSKFPVNDVMRDGFSPLLLASREEKLFKICQKLIENGAEINQSSNEGYTALSQSIINDNKKLAELLLKKDANMFNQHLGPEFKHQSAFYIALYNSKIWAVEMFYDYSEGVDF